MSALPYQHNFMQGRAMPLIAYIAVVLVSISGILFELDWLTKPKLESKPAMHASSAPAPAAAPRAVVKAEGPSQELNPVYPKKSDVPRAQEAASIAPATEPSASIVAGASVETTAKVVAKAEAEPEPQVPPQTTGQAAAQTTGTAPFADKAGHNLLAPVAASVAPRLAASAATPAAASAPPPLPPAATPVAQPVSTAANNRCDVQGCAGAYKSFRAADCSYQPFQGPRQACVKPPEPARVAAQPRAFDADRAGRRLSRDDDLRGAERTVRRMTRDDDADFDRDPFDDDDRQAIVFRRQGARW
jgi:hypothetical protein